MSASRPTASDRLKRGSPVTQPSAAQASSGPVRVKPYRLSIDLAPADYKHLKLWAAEAEMTHMEIVRALLRMLDDPHVAAQIRGHAAK